MLSFFLSLQPLILDELMIDLNQIKRKKKLKEIQLHLHNQIPIVKIDLQRRVKLFPGLNE